MKSIWGFTVGTYNNDGVGSPWSALLGKSTWNSTHVSGQLRVSCEACTALVKGLH